jgi:lipopolysaccharide biosynthesis glycosyltransferase
MNAIFQFFIGNPYGYSKCIESVNKYCQKYNIKHYLSSSRAYPEQHIMMEKYQILDLVNYDKDIKRVLYMDADILVTPNAENIFDNYEDFNGIYAYDENNNTDWMDRDKYIHTSEWPINSRGKKQYFNAGVMLFNANFLKNNNQIFNFNDIPKWEDIWYFGDQTIMNYWIVKNNIGFRTINHSFNRMDLGEYDLNNDRYKANFIHYAGPCKYGNGNKLDTMVNDYKALYAD